MSRSKQEIVVESRTYFVSAIWIAIALFLIIYFHKEDSGWADLGALISGVVAPLAWFWLIVTYNMQRQEMALQRQELTLQRQAVEKQVKELEFTREEITLQRQALQHQVNAQRGSEQALKAQSEALREQLRITQEQFAMYVKDYEARQPNFILEKLRSFKIETKFLEDNSLQILDLSSSLSDQIKFDKYYSDIYHISINLDIKNIGASSRILRLEKVYLSIIGFSYDEFEVKHRFEISPDTFMYETKDKDKYHVKFDVYFYESNPLSIPNEKDLFDFFIGIFASLRFDLVCRVGKQAYTYNYMIDTKGNYNLLLKKAKQESQKDIRRLPLSLMLTDGYQLKKYEKTTY